MSKRINVSINETDLQDLRSYCMAKGYTLSGFMVQSAMQVVKADQMLTLMRTLVTSLNTASMMTEQDKLKILETIQAMELLGGGHTGK